jgi:hypothetical protein
VDRRDDDPQVGGDRRLQGEQRERPLLGDRPDLVDVHVLGDHLLGELQIGLQQRPGGLLQRRGDLFAHAREHFGQLIELLLVDVPHATRLVVPPGPGRSAPVNRR